MTTLLLRGVATWWDGTAGEFRGGWCAAQLIEYDQHCSNGGGAAAGWYGFGTGACGFSCRSSRMHMGFVFVL